MPAIGVAVAVGIGVAVAERKVRVTRTFLAYLAVANVAFVALFALASPTSELLAGRFYADAGDVHGPALEGPVTVIVLDEFPLAAVVRGDGSINEVRYPNLAALAEQSTWFRNASSEVATTFVSVPEILTGVLATEDDLPTYRDHPRNLFTLFGGQYPLNRYEAITDLCPPQICEPPPAESLSQALSDASVLYGHRVLPAALRDSLPSIDGQWGDFGGELTVDSPVPASDDRPDGDPMAGLGDLPAADQGRLGQAAALRRQVAMISAEPSVNMIHVLLPHHPYKLTPWGVASTGTWLPKNLPAEGSTGHARTFAQVYAQQAMQIAAVDQLVGEVIEDMKASGAWENGTLVVTSDHGIDVTPPLFTRRIQDGNQDLVLRIPLFIKAPGQVEGEVRDDPASTLDVLPSLIDLLDIETEWELDGHSLFDGSEPHRDRALTTSLDEGLAAFARQQSLARPGDGWAGLLGIGPLGDLVETDVADHSPVPRARSAGATRGASALEDPASTRGVVPVLMSGHVHGGDQPPPDLVVALDGVISGTVGDYRRDADGWAFRALLGPAVEGGARDVVAYEVERLGDVVILHPLGT